MIFDEKEEAEKILKNGFSSFMSFKELLIIAKYFKYMGKNKTQIRKSLIEFCEKHNDEFNEVLARESIESAIDNAQKYSLRIKMDITITEDELEIIKHYENIKYQRILFVMLVVAKYFKYNHTKIKPKEPTPYDDNLYLNAKITEIIKISGLNINKKERNALIHTLETAGLIMTTYVGSFQIIFVDEDSPVGIVINDMNKIIDFFPFYCEKCGKKLEKKAKRHSMCEECYLTYRKEKFLQHNR